MLADSGIRRGGDVVKALALGAKAVLVGRLPLYGTAAGGEAGARDVLAMLRDEIERTMGFCGRTSIAALTRDLVQPAVAPSVTRRPGGGGRSSWSVSDGRGTKNRVRPAESSDGRRGQGGGEAPAEHRPTPPSQPVSACSIRRPRLALPGSPSGGNEANRLGLGP